MYSEDLHNEDQRDAQEQEWEEIAPVLASLDRGRDDEVPEGYFQDFSSDMMARIRAMEGGEAALPGDSGTLAPIEETQPSAVLPGQSWRIIGLAASLALLIVFGLIGYGNKADSGRSGGLDLNVERSEWVNVSEGELIDELSQTELSEEELYEMLGQEAQAALEGEVGEASQENIIDFLEEIDLDISEFQDLDLEVGFFNEEIL
ncbi:MAG TPA: hypothetical protein ENJ82_00690 [Bacteroidetes bacterium]|nr:hypothetical protein [Bacteroidota bacterium]